MKAKSHNFWKDMQILVALGVIGVIAVSSTFGDGGYYFVTAWGSQGNGYGEFNTANGVAVDQYGYVFVDDFHNSRVQKFTNNGEFISTWGEEIIPGRVEHLAVDLQGFVYVADYDRDKIVKFTSTGEFVTEWGGVQNPYGVAVDNQGHVFVSSHSGDSIHKFTDDGQIITSWGGTHGSDIGQFKYPNGIAVDGAGRVFVTDLWNERIQIFSSDGVFLDVWDYYDRAYDVCIDSMGYVYVANGDTDSPYRIQKFTSNGDLVTEWGTSGTGDGEFDRPRGIAVDLLGSVYVCDYGNYRIQKFVPELGVSPVADADGPYIINVGDTLTLDASGSTDMDNDIVSYIWDLDDDGAFETDAGGQAIFDVNYTYLQSLGLLVDHTYNIHLRVTDSQEQSDVNDSTLKIVPKPAIAVAVDIKPGSCPNPVNVKSKGVLAIAILGKADYDIMTIDPTSVRLAGVEPLRSGYEDVSTPILDAYDCNCTEAGPDGFLDLTLKFKNQKIVESVGEVNDGDVLELPLSGVLFDETPIEGVDCILIRGRHKPISPSDINKDGVVNAVDFAIFAQNWLESSIVDE